MNHDNDKSIKGNALFSLLKLTFGPIVRSTWVGNVTGLENLPESGSALIASNHASHLDFLLLSTISPRPIQFMVSEIFYTNPLISKAFDSMGHIKVNRGIPGDVSPLRKAVQRLEQGHVVTIYPEGTRSCNGNLQRAHGGVGFLALATGVPVIPVFLDGTYVAWPRHSRFPVPHKCAVHIGEPLRFFRTPQKMPKKEHIHTVTHDVMQAIARLGNVEYPR